MRKVVEVEHVNIKEICALPPIEDMPNVIKAKGTIYYWFEVLV